MRQAIITGASTIASASVRLIKGLLVEGTWGNDVMDLVKPLIGHCDDIEKLPETDRDALLSLLQKVRTVIPKLE